ncbi:hypothetical protein OAH43_00295 [bacterium]|nr:hypothetical protein [bacterium]
MNNKTLLIFGILLGSFITLFFVIYYNYTYNYENFYDRNLTDNNDSTNEPISLESTMNDENDSENNAKEIERKRIEIEKKEKEREKERDTKMCCMAMTPTCQACKAGISVEEYKKKYKNEIGGVINRPAIPEEYEKENTKDENSLSLNDSNDAGIAINECYSLFEVSDDNNNTTYNDYPLKENILMQISTEKETNIDNASNKWYDNFNYDFKSSNHDNNKFWFIISNNIKKLTNNKYATGALLKDIQLSGPSSMQFANNNNTLSLTKFTIVLTTKINSMDIGEKYCLFKMALQKDVDHTTQNDNTLSYGGHIALILTKKNCNNIALNIYFADKEFYWTNIPINILQKNIIISLSYLHNEGITILIDNLHKNFSFDILNEYKLGSTHIIINENGKLDMTLYNFTYYNTKLSNTDINSFININNHLLNNKHKINDNYLSQIKELELDVDNKKSIIQSLENRLANCQNNV